MKPLAYSVIGVFVMIGAISFIVTGIASGISDQGSPFPPSQGGSVTGIGTESTHTIGTIRYFVASGSGVYKHTLDSTNIIDISSGNSLVLQIPARVSGPDTQRGIVDVVLGASNEVTHSLLLTPGKQATLTTNPPLRWLTPGTYSVFIEVIAPDGGYTSRPITVHVDV